MIVNCMIDKVLMYLCLLGSFALFTGFLSFRFAFLNILFLFSLLSSVTVFRSNLGKIFSSSCYSVVIRVSKPFKLYLGVNFAIKVVLISSFRVTNSIYRVVGLGQWKWTLPSIL